MDIQKHYQIVFDPGTMRVNWKTKDFYGTLDGAKRFAFDFVSKHHLAIHKVHIMEISK